MELTARVRRSFPSLSSSKGVVLGSRPCPLASLFSHTLAVGWGGVLVLILEEKNQI